MLVQHTFLICFGRRVRRAVHFCYVYGVGHLSGYVLDQNPKVLLHVIILDAAGPAFFPYAFHKDVENPWGKPFGTWSTIPWWHPNGLLAPFFPCWDHSRRRRQCWRLRARIISLGTLNTSCLVVSPPFFLWFKPTTLNDFLSLSMEIDSPFQSPDPPQESL